MKRHFANAGKQAFTNNMGMPGSIQEEITAQVRGAVAPR